MVLGIPMTFGMLGGVVVVAVLVVRWVVAGFVEVAEGFAGVVCAAAAVVSAARRAIEESFAVIVTLV